MLVLYMVKPEYASNEAVSEISNFYLSPENKFNMLCDGIVRYSNNGSRLVPFTDASARDVYGNGVYMAIGDYSGTEKEWMNVRDEVLMLLNADDNVPHPNFNNKEIEKKGMKISEPCEDGVYLSAGYEASTKEVCQFVKLLQEFAKCQVKNNNYQMADDAISKLQSLSLHVATLNNLYKAVKQMEAGSSKKLEGDQAQEINGALKQLKAVSKVTDKACKDLKKDGEKVKYRYV